MRSASDPVRLEVVVIGAGQAGLSVGYHLARRGISFVILEARNRIGDQWRGRWDSLRLFTPARFDSLDGMPFPADPNSFPTKNEMGDYLESYAARFKLPVLTGMRVESLRREEGRFAVRAGGRLFEADNVVVAMANFQKARIPDFASSLDPAIVQIHSSDYKSPAQLQEGPVLIVGAGNSGAEIAKELAPRHRVWMSGRDVGQLPFRIEGRAGRLVLARLFLRVIFHRLLTVRTPIGRKVRPKLMGIGGPLIRVKSRELASVGVERAPRTVGVQGGKPQLEDGRVLDVANIIWCCGFETGLDWIGLPVLKNGEPEHASGVVESEPGLYFVGRHFLHALSSVMIHGVGRDADRIAGQIAARAAPEVRRADRLATV